MSTEKVTSTEQDEPSPLHSPQTSTTAVPPQTPAQSTSTVQLPSQSKLASSVHEPRQY